MLLLALKKVRVVKILPRQIPAPDKKISSAKFPIPPTGVESS